MAGNFNCFSDLTLLRQQKARTGKSGLDLFCFWLLPSAVVSKLVSLLIGLTIHVLVLLPITHAGAVSRSVLVVVALRRAEAVTGIAVLHTIILAVAISILSGD